ncbi:MAG: ABC transporter substrate-binding protein [Vicinamibacterales bacterium]
MTERSQMFAVAATAGLFIGASAAPVAQSAPAHGVTPTVITVGIEEAANSFSTDEENLGFRLAFQEANDAGGVHGRTIAWKGYPRTAGDAAAEALANARRLVQQDGVFALVNWGGPQSIPLLEFATSQRVPYLFPHTALISSEGRRYLFTSFPRFEGEAAVMFPYLARERRLTRLGIVHDVNAYGQLFLERLRALAAEGGYTVVGHEPVDARDPGDLTAALRRLVDAGASAVVMALYPAQGKKVVEAKGAIGWRGTLVSAGPLTDEQLLAVPGGHADGTLGFCYYPDPDVSTEPGVTAYRAAMARYHAGRPRNRYSLYGYTFGRLIVEGLHRAGRDLTRERLVDALESIRAWDAGGVMPPVSFTPTDHHAQTAGFVCELKDGRFESLSGWIEP